MDINALLSPDHLPREPSSPTSDARRKRRPGRTSGGERTTSGLCEEIRRSPDGITSAPTSRPTSGYATSSRSQQAFPLHAIADAAPNFRPLHLTSTSNPSPARGLPSSHDYAQTQQRPVVAHRPLSTPQMDTWADLASMQHRHQTSRAHSSNYLHLTEIVEAQRSPTSMRASNPPPILRNLSGQSLADLTMAEAPADSPPPREFVSSALTDAESQTVRELLSYLHEHSYDYGSHVRLINVLHKGFRAHVYPPSDSDAKQSHDPQTYGLLKELRQARGSMDSRFAVGEDLWLDWLSDEALLVRASEERISVTELFQKAVQDEPASVRLWQAYADWILANYAACNTLEGSDQTGWTDEDKELCRELFTREMLLSVLEQSIAATQWRVDESHLLWNRYVELAQQDLPASPSTADVDRLREMFLQRLRIPHSTSSETKSMLWSIVNKYDPENWEVIMDRVDGLAEPARKQMGLLDEHELEVTRALQSGDLDALHNAFASYLKWEGKNRRKLQNDYELRCALFERALLRFPTYTEWWLDYIDYVIGSTTKASVLPLIERATRHCPWSGDLWARRILRSDVEQKPHDEIEATKHRATNSGLLVVGGLEELLKVLQQWCSYLRRHAFQPGSSEDDIDTAEVGITMALEDIQNAGMEIYGKYFNGDPLHRLETIQIKFFTEARRLNDAREIYKRLVPMHKGSSNFWSKYYAWELWNWGHERLSEIHRVETSHNGPHLATNVVQEALSQRNLDRPEKVSEMYLNHFQQHESGEKLQAALIEAREFSKRLASKRAKEAETAAQTTQQLYPAATNEAQPLPRDVPTGEKRKADGALPDSEVNKKTKTDDVPTSAGGNDEPSPSAPVKRDREHNTVTVRNLPADVEELDIKKFFRDVGQPLSVNILRDKATDSATASVEFESHVDVLAAKTRNGRDLRGHEVRISSGSQNTLYVANYPPEYDENAMRKLFDSYGEIVSVRFPSLKFNNRRRFCYVQFITDEMARAAEDAMDNKMLDGRHKLVAKVSNPDAKKQRSGAQAEGRELFVKNLDRHADESEVKSFFSQYGVVISMNLLRLVNNKLTGSGFIVFASADEANAALAANNKPFRDRILHVEISQAKGGAAPLDRARKTDIIVKGAASASPEPDVVNGRRGSDVSMASRNHESDPSFKTARERKIAIFNLPDTVSDARIRAAMEHYGPILKIQLRRQDHGAIVEFANINDAFNVRQGVDCSSLGNEVKTGDVSDLLAKVKTRQSADGPASSSVAMRPPAITRPGQRGGRRGGLGFKREGVVGAKAHEGQEGAEKATSDHGTGETKSNADFRAMLEKSKTGAKAADGGSVEI